MDLRGRINPTIQRPAYESWLYALVLQEVWFLSTPLSRSKEYLVVPAGLLDDDPLAKPERSIFWDDHASWYSSVDAIPKFAEGPGSLIRENEK